MITFAINRNLVRLESDLFSRKENGVKREEVILVKCETPGLEVTEKWNTVQGKANT